jgi:hypothetical protein
MLSSLFLLTGSGLGGLSQRKKAGPKRKGDTSVAGEVILPSKMTPRKCEAEAKKKSKVPLARP